MPRRRMPQDAVPPLDEVVARQSAGYRTVGEMAYAVIREAIITGALRPGQKLRQEALAEAIGVSRIPVRSALMQLESEGLVVFRPHRGAMVRSLSAETLRETYSIRALLEVRALELSMRTMTPERAKTLTKLAGRLDDPRRKADFLADRVAFYHELYSATENPVLVSIIDQLRSSVGRELLGLRLHQHGHRDLVSHVVDGDLKGARNLLRAHLGEVCESLLAQLE